MYVRISYSWSGFNQPYSVHDISGWIKSVFFGWHRFYMVYLRYILLYRLSYRLPFSDIIISNVRISRVVPLLPIKTYTKEKITRYLLVIKKKKRKKERRELLKYQRYRISDIHCNSFKGKKKSTIRYHWYFVRVSFANEKNRERTW